jgi:hypothetical protein
VDFDPETVLHAKLESNALPPRNRKSSLGGSIDCAARLEDLDVGSIVFALRRRRSEEEDRQESRVHFEERV